jgi:hypothetical protein
MRAFNAYQHLTELPLAATYLNLRKQIEEIRTEMDNILVDKNDINEITRAQPDAISTALAKLQAKPAASKPRHPSASFSLRAERKTPDFRFVPLCQRSRFSIHRKAMLTKCLTLCV